MDFDPDDRWRIVELERMVDTLIKACVLIGAAAFTAGALLGWMAA